MNTTEGFFTSASKHSTLFHSVPDTNSVLYHSRSKQFNISFISGTFIPKPIPAIYVGYEELLNVIPVKMFTYDQFYLSIKYENKFCYPHFKYNSSDLGAANWNYSGPLSARCNTLVPAVQDVLVDEWTSSLDLLNPPSRSPPTQMITTVDDDQRFPNYIQASKRSQDVRPSSRCQNSLTEEQHHHFYYFLSINIPFINIIKFYFNLKIMQCNNSKFCTLLIYKKMFFNNETMIQGFTEFNLYRNIFSIIEIK